MFSGLISAVVVELDSVSRRSHIYNSQCCKSNIASFLLKVCLISE